MSLLPSAYLPKVAAVTILIVLYWLAKLPDLSSAERSRLSAQFSFVREPLPEPDAPEPKEVRIVHPQLEGISAWISSVGAAATITDLDGNGLCNDIIHVDPRFDKVIVSPAVGTSSHYGKFELFPSTLKYDTDTMAPMGSLAYDFNLDGQTDILIYYWGRSPVIFYQDHGSFVATELNPKVERWFSNAATLADFDGDGYVDILVANYFPDGSRILDGKATDHDQTMQHSMSRAWNGGDDHFYLFAGMDDGKAAFSEHTEWRKDIDNLQDWTLAVAAADINGDFLPEIYFANDFGPDKFFYNISTPGQIHFKELKGTRRFTDIRSAVLGKDSFKGMGVCFADINADGLLDIYVSNIAAHYGLEESHFVFINDGQFDKMKEEGIAPFHNESEKLGLSRSSWSWESKLADFNNDGILEALQGVGFIKGKDDKWAELQELAIGNDELMANASVWPHFTPGTELSGRSHNPFFVKSESGRYFDIADEVGLGNINICRGIAISDVDHDGDADFITANQWEPSFLFKNNYTGKNRFLGLRLMHEKASRYSIEVDPGVSEPRRFAVGASIKLRVNGRTSVPAFVDGGNGHSGKNSNEIFIGLGAINTTPILNLEIQWRNAAGAIEKENLQLSDGWHTIVLPFNK